jgi:hypothetical protein
MKPQFVTLGCYALVNLVIGCHSASSRPHVQTLVKPGQELSLRPALQSQDEAGWLHTVLDADKAFSICRQLPWTSIPVANFDNPDETGVVIFERAHLNHLFLQIQSFHPHILTVNDELTLGQGSLHEALEFHAIQNDVFSAFGSCGATDRAARQSRTRADKGHAQPKYFHINLS